MCLPDTVAHPAFARSAEDDPVLHPLVSYMQRLYSAPHVRRYGVEPSPFRRTSYDRFKDVAYRPALNII